MVELIPVIVVLIFLEVLLSIDNALFNAAIASEFEDEEKKKMLRMGMLIEISFRLITLFLMSLIIQNVWLKFLCGIYLIIIALKHLAGHVDKEGHIVRPPESRRLALFQITAANRAFSINNIFLVASFTARFEVIVTVIAFSMAFIALCAPYLAKGLKKYKGLPEAVFSIILFLGGIMLYEAVTSSYVVNEIKIAIILSVLLFTVVFEHSLFVRKVFSPALLLIVKAISVPFSYAVEKVMFAKTLVFKNK